MQTGPAEDENGNFLEDFEKWVLTAEIVLFLKTFEGTQKEGIAFGMAADATAIVWMVLKAVKLIK